MKLDDFLKKNGIKKNFFANKIGCTPQRLQTWLNGKALPPLKFIAEIEKATGGKVKYTDFIVEELDQQ